MRAISDSLERESELQRQVSPTALTAPTERAAPLLARLRAL